MNPLFGIVMVNEQESGSSGGSPFKKWFMRQYWRVQQSQTIISMAFWVTTLTLLIWPYLRWRFENDSTIAGISTTYFGLIGIGATVIILVLLIGVVLMQASQGGGLSGTFGGNAASTVLGGQNAGNVLSRITTWLATLFLVLAVIISILSGPSDSSSSSIVQQAAENRPDVQPMNTSSDDESSATLDLDAE